MTKRWWKRRECLLTKTYPRCVLVDLSDFNLNIRWRSKFIHQTCGPTFSNSSLKTRTALNLYRLFGSASFLDWNAKFWRSMTNKIKTKIKQFQHFQRIRRNGHPRIHPHRFNRSNVHVLHASPYEISAIDAIRKVQYARHAHLRRCHQYTGKGCSVSGKAENDCSIGTMRNAYDVLWSAFNWESSCWRCSIESSEFTIQ